MGLVGKHNEEIDILYLNEEDMIKAGVLNASRCVDVMEETMKLMDEGDFLMGGPDNDSHGLMINFPKKSEIENFPLDDAKDRRFLAMPAYVGGRFHVCGVKWYGSNGRNRNKGLPRSILMVMLNDVETGIPIAYMSANLLSSMRTGAMPGLAAQYLARPESEVLALIGPGSINKSCFRAIISKMKNLNTVKIKGSSVTSKTALSMKQFIEEEYPQIKNIILCETLEEAIRDSDIVCEAVSCNNNAWPVYKREWFKPGSTIISASVFCMDRRSIIDIKKVVDNLGMYENYADEDQLGFDDNGERVHSGCMGEDFVYMMEDGLIERESIIELPSIVNGTHPGRTSDDEVILVSIEGMPTEDVAWAYECYTNAKKLAFGQSLKLW